ncbi:olfactory receptor 8G5-like [Panthera onca]|uniref:olfactory receptor 8G5-like n=1 Tax=Panthera onca TaxID=9690 RepID=UPI002953405D|nr:olfactory receptor 8G5-like [Panthera onca]
MAAENLSTVAAFILTGLTQQPELQLPLFFLFLGIYVVTVVGNLVMITLIGLSAHLHTPMYYFLSNLSFIDLCHSTVITPKMLVNFVTEMNTISYSECITQLYFFLVFAISECYMLTAMAYDRYVAICSPLLYNINMSHQACFSLIWGVYIIALVCAFVHTGCLFRVHFCKFAVINHYFCDLLSLLKLSCSSTHVNELLILVFSAINILAPSLMILSSYIFIIASMLRIRSTEGRAKAFSTCSSHISAVAVFFGSAAFMYLQPSSVSSLDQGKVSSVFYTIVVPMLNPLIYSLRNKDVNVALKKMLERRIFL